MLELKPGWRRTSLMHQLFKVPKSPWKHIHELLDLMDASVNQHVNLVKWFIYKNNMWRWPFTTINTITGRRKANIPSVMSMLQKYWPISYFTVSTNTFIALNIPRLNLFHIIKIVFNVQLNHFWHFSSRLNFFYNCKPFTHKKLHNTSC